MQNTINIIEHVPYFTNKNLDKSCATSVIHKQILCFICAKNTKRE